MAEQKHVTLIVAMVAGALVLLAVSGINPFTPSGDETPNEDHLVSEARSAAAEEPQPHGATVLTTLHEFEKHRMEGAAVDLEMVLKRCGQPDGYTGLKARELELMYYYNKLGEKDWVCYAKFSRGKLTGIGWEASPVSDKSHFRKWDAKPPEVTAVAALDEAIRLLEAKEYEKYFRTIAPPKVLKKHNTDGTMRSIVGIFRGPHGEKFLRRLKYARSLPPAVVESNGVEFGAGFDDPRMAEPIVMEFIDGRWRIMN